MFSEFSIASANYDDAQRLLEKISELEQELWNSRRLHQTIERNNRMFEALLASSRDGIALTRLDGVIIRVIRGLAGWEPGMAAGMSVFALIHPDDVARVRDAYRQFAEKRAVKVEQNVRLVQPDGSHVRIASTMTDMLDDPAVHAIVHNYRRLLDPATCDLTTAIEHAPFAAFSKRTGGEILTWNRGARDIFGYEAHEIVGRPVSVIVPPELVDEEREARETVIASEAALPKIHTERLRKDGSRIALALVLCPLMSGGRVAALAHLSYPL